MHFELFLAGSFNKVFVLKFDTGAQVVVRIPCPVVGNVEQTTASEVATMCYLSERWAHQPFEYLPAFPKVLAWSATYRNPVETPYIIMEYAEGVTLESRWGKIKGPSAGAALRSISDLEYCLLRDCFSQNGSLYFAYKVHEETRSLPLYPYDVLAEGGQFSEDLASRYRIGPTASREWWRGVYAHVEADRGPCGFCTYSESVSRRPGRLTSAFLQGRTCKQ